MAFAWNAWAVLWIVSAALQLGTSLLIYSVGPQRLLNRALSVTLFFGGTISVGYVLGAMATTEADAYAAAVIAQLSKFVVVALYAVFLGAALSTPLVRPLRARWVRAALIAAAVIAPLIVVVRPDWFIGPRVERAFAEFNFSVAPASAALDVVGSILFLYALVAAISAYRRALPGTPAKDRARWFMLAFGTRDVAIAGFILMRGTVLRGGPFADVAQNIIFAGVVCLYVILLVYGVLKWHLFDLDVKIKWTLRRGSVAAIFLAVFFVVTEIAQNGFSARFGWIWGSVAAGLLLFGLVPLQRLSERMANAAMPGVSGSAEYLAHRRAEVYKGALEEILADGVVTPKERAILRKLQEKLGLGSETASAIERDVREAFEGRE